MSPTVKCPICLNEYGGSCQQSVTPRDSTRFNCEICGAFEVTRSALVTYLAPNRSDLTSIQRAALANSVRSAQPTMPIISSDWLGHFIANARLPNPAIQATNLIRFIGDHVSQTGEKVSRFQPQIYAVIGAPNPHLAGDLLAELRERGLIDGTPAKSVDMPTDVYSANLTLGGWEQYESEKRGETSGEYGFLAMKFGDAALDTFVTDILKPAVKEGIGYDLVDMRDISRAGIIDNIMRAKIRDSAFVVVDLTHDNAGAYWEAGYAEGLGKPVIYICEVTKFEKEKTHFDTNHCTTVPWKSDDGTSFKRELVATLRRSLALF